MANLAIPATLTVLIQQIILLSRLAPSELRGLELLVDDALARHQEEARAARLTRRVVTLRRVK
jgi:hypothetical protein